MAGYGGYNPLAAMLAGGYGMGGMGGGMMGNPTMAMMGAYNPALLQVQPQIQLGNELEQQGVSAAPILSPWQGLSKLAGVLVGRHMLDKAYGQLGGGNNNTSGGPEPLDAADQAYAATIGDPNSSQVAYFKAMPEYQRKMIEYQTSGDIIKGRADLRAVKPGEPVVGPGQPPITSPVPLGAEAGAEELAKLQPYLTRDEYAAALDAWKSAHQTRSVEQGGQIVSPDQTPPPAPPSVGGAGTPPAPPGAQGGSPLTVGNYYRLFRGAEGSGPNAVSDKGAHGVYQITQGTFNQYARKGEDFNSEDDRQAVAQRAIDDLYTRYGSDPQRMAVAYFSGPGNVAPQGSPTPWKEDISDGHTLTSRYAAKFPQAGAAPAPTGAPKTVAQALQQQHQQQQPGTFQVASANGPITVPTTPAPTDAQGNPIAVPVGQPKGPMSGAHLGDTFTNAQGQRLSYTGHGDSADIANWRPYGANAGGEPASTAAGQPAIPAKPVQTAQVAQAPMSRTQATAGGGSVTQYGTPGAAGISEENNKDYAALQSASAKAYDEIGKAQLLKKKLAEIPMGGPPTEFMAHMAKIAQWAGVDPDTIKKYGLPDGATADEADSLARGLQGEIMHSLFPQRITNTDITVSKPMIPNMLMFPESRNWLIDNAIVPRAQRDIDRFQSVRGMKNADPSLNGLSDALFDFDSKRPLSSYTPALVKAEGTSGGTSSGAPPVPNAKQAPDGNWYVPDPGRPGKYLKVVSP